MMKTVAGLYIDSDLIKLAILEDGAMPVVKSVHTFRTLSDAQETLRNVDTVITTIPEKNIINASTEGARNIRSKLVEITVNKVSEDYKLQFEHYDSFPIREYEKTIKNLGSVTTVHDGIKIIRDDSEIDALVNSLHKENIRTEVIDSEALALYNLFSYVTREVKIPDSMALIDVNPKRILLVLLKQNKEYCYSRYILFDDGSAIQNLESAFISEDIIKKTGVISRAMISGDCQLAEIVQNELASSFEDPIRILPLDIENKPNIMLEVDDSDEYAVSIGLALRALVNTPTNVNFLAKKLKSKARSLIFQSIAIMLLLIMWSCNLLITSSMIPDIKKVESSFRIKLSDVKNSKSLGKIQNRITSYLEQFKISEDAASRFSKDSPLMLDVLDHLADTWAGKVKQLKITGNDIYITTFEGTDHVFKVVSDE